MTDGAMGLVREVMDVREAADYLRLSVSTVYDLVSRGLLPVVKIGSSNRFRIESLRAFVAEREIKSAGDAARLADGRRSINRGK